MDERPTQPMDSDEPNGSGTAPEERRFGEAPAMAVKWLADLQAIVDNLATQSAPVIRSGRQGRRGCRNRR